MISSAVRVERGCLKNELTFCRLLVEAWDCERQALNQIMRAKAIPLKKLLNRNSPLILWMKSLPWSTALFLFMNQRYFFEAGNS